MTEMSRRPSGTPPYWSPGTQIMWREGSGLLGTGAPGLDLSTPHFAQPVTVVRDDADALVAWLRVGTPVLSAERADGLVKRADTSDHVLDVVVGPDRAMRLKDEDELELAVAQGVFDPAAAASIEAHAAEVQAVVARWGPPFCDGWERFRPDPVGRSPSFRADCASSPTQRRAVPCPPD